MERIKMRRRRAPELRAGNAESCDGLTVAKLQVRFQVRVALSDLRFAGSIPGVAGGSFHFDDTGAPLYFGDGRDVFNRNRRHGNEFDLTLNSAVREEIIMSGGIAGE